MRWKEAVQAAIAALHQNLEAVLSIFLDIIVMLVKLDYLVPPEGNTFLIEIMQIIYNKPPVGIDIRMKFSKVFKVSLPKLMVVVCHLKNHTIFVPVGKQSVFKGMALGPHILPWQLFPEAHLLHVPTELLIHVLQLARNPSGQAELGVVSLRLLQTVQPLTSLKPAIKFVCVFIISNILSILHEHDMLTLKQQEWENELKLLREYLIAVNKYSKY